MNPLQEILDARDAEIVREADAQAALLPPGTHWTQYPVCSTAWREVPKGATVYAEFAQAFSAANPELAWCVEFDIASTPWRSTMHRISIEGLGELVFPGFGPHVTPYELASLWPSLAWNLVAASVALAFVRLAEGAPQADGIVVTHAPVVAPHRALPKSRKPEPKPGSQVQYRLRGRWSREENGVSTRAYGYSLMRGEVQRLPDGRYRWVVSFGEAPHRSDTEATRTEACRMCDAAADHDVLPKWLDEGTHTVRRQYGFTGTVDDTGRWEVSRGMVLKRGAARTVYEAIHACDDGLEDARRADDATRLHELDAGTLLLARGSGGELAEAIEQMEGSR